MEGVSVWVFESVLVFRLDTLLDLLGAIGLQQ
jgi:hypothetical protein